MKKWNVWFQLPGKDVDFRTVDVREKASAIAHITNLYPTAKIGHVHLARSSK